MPNLDTTTITQVAIVVHDIEAKVKAWADVLGVPVPEIMITAPLEESQLHYQGEPSEARAKLAFISLGQVTLELIEPIDGPSTWRDALEQHGESLHHIAFNIKSMKEKIAYLDAKGVPLVQTGEYTGGRYAYVNGTPKLGAVLELLENDLQ
jgi:catechol 2,3-dioxygenase-like lactoylglutathione lyase family enzyme